LYGPIAEAYSSKFIVTTQANGVLSSHISFYQYFFSKGERERERRERGRGEREGEGREIGAKSR
jgi:hypothetical protein